ncbi:unnamed protein product [Closterium sp. NIES-65]|nr:unnamed protein product [Closterium sp. NIES-65]
MRMLLPQSLPAFPGNKLPLPSVTSFSPFASPSQQRLGDSPCSLPFSFSLFASLPLSIAQSPLPQPLQHPRPSPYLSPAPSPAPPRISHPPLPPPLTVPLTRPFPRPSPYLSPALPSPLSAFPRLSPQNTNLEQSEELALLQARARHQDAWSCIKGTVSSLYSSLHSSLPQQWHSSTAPAPTHPVTPPCSLSSSSAASPPTLFQGPLLVSLVASLSLALLLSLLSFLRPIFLRFRALQAEREAATATANPLTPFGGLGMGVAQRGGVQGGGGVLTDKTGAGAGIGEEENGRGGMGGGGDGGVGGRPDLTPEDVARDYEEIVRCYHEGMASSYESFLRDSGPMSAGRFQQAFPLGRPDLTPEDVARDYEEIVRCYHEGMASSYESFLRDSGAMSAGRFRGGMPPKFRPKPKQR